MKGTTKSSVHQVFADRLTELQQRDAKKASEGFRAAGQRVWQVPANFAGQLTDVPTLHKPAWDRTAPNSNYADCMKGVDGAAGTVGDVISLKMQIDYNASEERAFRRRHATVARCLCHQLARRDGHSQSNLFPMIVRQVSDASKIGGLT
jgi:hypothetical protein